jgi:hypothetical protein
LAHSASIVYQMFSRCVTGTRVCDRMIGYPPYVFLHKTRIPALPVNFLVVVLPKSRIATCEKRAPSHKLCKYKSSVTALAQTNSAIQDTSTCSQHNRPWRISLCPSFPPCAQGTTRAFPMRTDPMPPTLWRHSIVPSLPLPRANRL